LYDRNRPPCFDEQVYNRAADTDPRHVRSDFVGALIRASRYEAEGALRQLQRGLLVIRRAGEHESIKGHRRFGTNREIRAVLEDKLRRTIATGGHQLLSEYILAGINLKSPRSQRPIDLVANRNGNANRFLRRCDGNAPAPKQRENTYDTSRTEERYSSHRENYSKLASFRQELPARICGKTV
jgi:hypothetical protein